MFGLCRARASSPKAKSKDERAKMKEMSRIRSTGMGGSVLYTVKDGVISSVVEKSIIQQQFLTLLLLSCVCLVVVLYQLFGGQKVAKSPGTRKKSSQVPFAHAAECDPSVGHLLVTPGFRLFSGCCGSHCMRQFTKNIIAALRLNGPRTMA